MEIRLICCFACLSRRFVRSSIHWFARGGSQFHALCYLSLQLKHLIPRGAGLSRACSLAAVFVFFGFWLGGAIPLTLRVVHQRDTLERLYKIDDILEALQLRLIA